MIHLLVHFLISVLKTRAQLQAENLALRQQLAVFKAERPRPRLNTMDRWFWVALRRFWSGWANALIIVQPATVVRWHRVGFRLYWRWKSRYRPHGRPRVDPEIRSLVRRMARDNPTWGAPRVHGELLKLGFEVSERTVSRYMPKRPAPAGSVQRWMTFLQNHRSAIAGMDFFTVPTVHFAVLYVFFVIHHQRDAKFSAEVVAMVRAMRIEPSRTSFRSPWQNGVAERWVLSVRRELLDHVVVFNRRHLVKLLGAYLAYYARDRTHLTIDKDPPETRAVDARPSRAAKVIGTPRVGGLHHRYEWRTAA